ncbi:CCC motif membrane protein [Kordia sp.]|uniref:CCC motif membrane protein n=1 Tax=Kordia sp. TaxID=1965332 RepID=UPI003B5B351C
MNSRKLPNATLIVVLGALSIVGCCFYNIGLILGLVAIFFAMKDTKIYRENPDGYDNFSTVNTGKILAIIGVVINLITLLFFIWALTTFGWEALQDQEELQRLIQERYGQ